MAKASQRQIVAQITPNNDAGHSRAPRFDDQTLRYFAQVSGGEITANVEKVYDGGALTPEVLCAPSEIGDITVTRHFSEEDSRALALARQLVGQVYYDVKVYTLDCDLQNRQADRIYTKALLVGISEPDGDSASGAPATYSLTFSVGSVAADV
jgi:hypothetical protein